MDSSPPQSRPRVAASVLTPPAHVPITSKATDAFEAPNASLRESTAEQVATAFSDLVSGAMVQKLAQHIVVGDSEFAELVLRFLSETPCGHPTGNQRLEGLAITEDDICMTAMYLMFRQPPIDEYGLQIDHVASLLMALLEDTTGVGHCAREILETSCVVDLTTGVLPWDRLAAMHPDRFRFSEGIDHAIDGWVASVADAFDERGFLEIMTGYVGHAIGFSFFRTDTGGIYLIVHDHLPRADLTRAGAAGSDGRCKVPYVYAMERSDLPGVLSGVLKVNLHCDSESWAEHWSAITGRLTVVTEHTRPTTLGAAGSDLKKLRTLQTLLAQHDQIGASCVVIGLLNLMLCGLAARALFVPAPAFSAVVGRGRHRADPESRPTAPDALNFEARVDRFLVGDLMDAAAHRPRDEHAVASLAIPVIALVGPRHPRRVVSLLLALGLGPEQRLYPGAEGKTLAQLAVDILGPTDPEALADLMRSWAPNLEECAVPDDQGHTLPMHIAAHCGSCDALVAAQIIERLDLDADHAALTDSADCTLVDFVRAFILPGAQYEATRLLVRWGGTTELDLKSMRLSMAFRRKPLSRPQR